MLVATEPFKDSDFEYPEVVLNPFSAKTITVISQSDAKKAWEEEEQAAKEQNEEDTLQTIKPDSIKAAEILQQTLTLVKKKETPTIEVPQERTEAPKPNFAPIPATTARSGLSS